MASSNIDGQTWHSFLGLGRGFGKIEKYKEMKEFSKASSREKMKNVKVIIIDEISLESNQQDNFLNDYLNDVFEVPENKRGVTFYNNLCIIKVGDFKQLTLLGTPTYENSSKQPYNIWRPNIWQDHFHCFELTQNMRQKNDYNFAQVLNTI